MYGNKGHCFFVSLTLSEKQAIILYNQNFQTKSHIFKKKIDTIYSLSSKRFFVRQTIHIRKLWIWYGYGQYARSRRSTATARLSVGAASRSIHFNPVGRLTVDRWNKSVSQCWGETIYRQRPPKLCCSKCQLVCSTNSKVSLDMGWGQGIDTTVVTVAASTDDVS